MTKSRAFLLVAAFSFVVLLLDVLRQAKVTGAPAHVASIVSTAVAGGSCAVPPMEHLAGNWHVIAASCTSGACKAAHFSIGDKLSFQQDISGVKNFSVAAVAAATGRRVHTEGYELRSDGVGNAVGQVVLDHNPLDGTPLALHWMVAKLRSYDSDGMGNCKERATIAFCDQQPANGSAQCTTQQHDGGIVVDPG